MDSAVSISFPPRMVLQLWSPRECMWDGVRIYICICSTTLSSTGQVYWTSASYFWALELFVFLCWEEALLSFASENTALVCPTMAFFWPVLTARHLKLVELGICMCVKGCVCACALGWDGTNAERKHTLKLILLIHQMLLIMHSMRGTFKILEQSSK